MPSLLSDGPSIGRREVAVRSFPRLGAVNAALVSLYFAPVWGIDALRALTSRYYGFEDRLHAAAVGYYRTLFDLGLDGLMRMSSALSAIKFVIAIGFVAYLIDFARALVVKREPNRETLDAVLVLASSAFMLWAWPALGTGDGGLIRLQATQFLLLTGAMIVLMVERHLEEGKAAAPQAPAPAYDQEKVRHALAAARLKA
jgi:hypothetical protein